MSGWKDLGYQPDGQVRGSYRIVGNANGFGVDGASDVDGDDLDREWAAGWEKGTRVVDYGSGWACGAVQSSCVMGLNILPTPCW